MRWKMQREAAGCGGIFHRASVTPTTCLASAATSATLRKVMVVAATALQRKRDHNLTAANPHGPLSLCVQIAERWNAISLVEIAYPT